MPSPSPDPTDTRFRDILASARAGSREAMGELFEAYKVHLLQLAREQIPPDLLKRMSPSDAYQETLIAAQQCFEKFRRESAGAFHEWLVAILLNVCRDFQRASQRQKRQADRELSFASVLEEGQIDHGPSAESSPLDEMIQREISSLMRGALQQLEEWDRTALRLRFYEGLSFQEMGLALGLSEEAARKRFIRVMGKAAKIMQGLHLDELAGS